MFDKVSMNMEMTILGGLGVEGRICICMTLRPKQATLIL